MAPYLNENFKRELNTVPQPLCLYVFGSVFLVNSTDPNKQLPNVISAFKYLSNLVYKKYIFITRNIYLLLFKG